MPAIDLPLFELKEGRVFVVSRDISEDQNPKKVAEFRCNCKYPWLRELHGLTQVMMSNKWPVIIFYVGIIIACSSISIANTTYIMRTYSEEESTTLITIVPVKKLKYPTLVFCPKNPDGLQYEHVYRDIYEHVGILEQNVTDDLIRYMIAGTGFDNMDISEFTPTYTREINNLYERWRGNRTTLELFRFVFDRNGITCQEFFVNCYAGSQYVDCCELFEPHYVMLRGRCFRLKPPFYQTDVDETDKLSLYFNSPRSPLAGKTESRSQLVTYIGDDHPEVYLNPRFYLNLNDWNRLRLIQKKISMLPASSYCSTDPISQGKGKCFVRKWLENQVIGFVNCTFPYFYDMLEHLQDVPICEPKVVVENYSKLMSTFIENKCQPACNRIDTSWTTQNSIDYSPSVNYSFRLEASFNNMEVEHYDEVRTTSLAGFISELGGQSGLFVGCSVITFVQLFQSIIIFIYKRTRLLYVKYVKLRLCLFCCGK